MGNNAQFSGKIGTIAVGEKNVKVVLTLSKKDFFRNSRFFESDPEEVNVVLGDPQMSIDDYDDSSDYPERDIYEAPKGMRVTTDASGVVEKVEDPEDGQTVLFESEEVEEASETEENGPTKEELEQYILSHKPKFEEIQFDPELLQFKVDSGSSWMEVATKYNLNSKELQREWSKYKKQVALSIKGQALSVDNGAA